MDKEKNDNRRNILNHALDLFYARGYEAVGVQEIAASAGVTKPTLYYYFKSKYGLLESVLEDTVEKFIKILKNVVKESDSVEDCLLNMAKTYIEYVTSSERNLKVFSMFLSMEYSPKDSEQKKAIEKYDSDIFMIFLSIFTDNKEKLGNMNGRQEQFAVGFMGLLNYYLLVYRERRLVLGDNESNIAQLKISDEQIRLLVHQFMYGIFS